MKSFTKTNLHSVIFTVFSNTSLKLTTGIGIGIYSFLFDPLKTQLYYAIAVLIVFDFITAVVSALKNKIKITSHEASRTLVKLLLYGIMVSAATMVDRFVMGFAQLFSDLTMAFIAITEFISIIENIRRYGLEVPTSVLARLKFLKKQETLDQIDLSTDLLHNRIDKEADKIKDTI